MKKFLNKIRDIFYCGVKTKEWDNVHYEYESAESGRWYNFGESRLYHFKQTNLYILGIPVYVINYESEDKGLYSSPYEDVNK